MNLRFPNVTMLKNGPFAFNIRNSLARHCDRNHNHFVHVENENMGYCGLG